MHTNLGRSLVCGIAALMSTHDLAAEPTSVVQGVGGQAPKQPQAAVTADGIVHLV